MAKKRKKTHGGKRKGAGRPASESSRQGMIGVRPTSTEAAMISDLLADHGSKSEVFRAGLRLLYWAKYGTPEQSGIIS